MHSDIDVNGKPVRAPKKNDLWSDRRGGGVVEYVIIIGCVACLAYGAFKIFGTQIKTTITEQSTTLKDIPTK